MADFLQNKLQWFQSYRHDNLTQQITIGYDVGSAVAIQATVPSSKASATQDGETRNSNYFHFIVRRSDLVDNSIKLARGLKIFWAGDEYTIALVDRKLLYYYNDPQKNDVVIQTVCSGDEDAIS